MGSCQRLDAAEGIVLSRLTPSGGMQQGRLIGGGHNRQPGGVGRFRIMGESFSIVSQTDSVFKAEPVRYPCPGRTSRCS